MRSVQQVLVKWNYPSVAPPPSWEITYRMNYYSLTIKLQICPWAFIPASGHSIKNPRLFPALANDWPQWWSFLRDSVMMTAETLMLLKKITPLGRLCVSGDRQSVQNVYISLSFSVKLKLLWKTIIIFKKLSISGENHSLNG